jgi:hypothetical protein
MARDRRCSRVWKHGLRQGHRLWRWQCKLRQDRQFAPRLLKAFFYTFFYTKTVFGCKTAKSHEGHQKEQAAQSQSVATLLKKVKNSEKHCYKTHNPLVVGSNPTGPRQLHSGIWKTGRRAWEPVRTAKFQFQLAFGRNLFALSIERLT